MPLVRSILARALFARGDIAGAADRTLAALDAAFSITFEFPLAICLETAALVLRGSGVDSGDLALPLASAEVIRERGDRPAPAPVAAGISLLRAALGTELIGVPVMSARAAGALVVTRLSALPLRHSDLPEPV